MFYLIWNQYFGVNICRNLKKQNIPLRSKNIVSEKFKIKKFKLKEKNYRISLQSWIKMDKIS